MIDIDERINLYSEIYGKVHQIVSKANPDNARYVASEIFKEVARDLRSELISELQRENGRGAEIKREESSEIKEKGEVNNESCKPKEENAKLATEKQREALHKFGIASVPENLTKKDAYGVLNSLISLSRERDTRAITDLVEELNKDWA